MTKKNLKRKNEVHGKCLKTYIPFARNPVPPVIRNPFPLRNLTIPIPSCISAKQVVGPPYGTKSFTAISAWLFPFGDKIKLPASLKAALWSVLTNAALSVKTEEIPLGFTTLPLSWQYTTLLFLLKKHRSRFSGILKSLIGAAEEELRNKASIIFQEMWNICRGKKERVRN